MQSAAVSKFFLRPFALFSQFSNALSKRQQKGSHPAEDVGSYADASTDKA